MNRDYWIVNLVDRVLEVYRRPAPDPTAPFGWRYSSRQALGPESSALPLAPPTRACASATSCRSLNAAVVSARDVAPDDVAPVRAPLEAFIDHALRLRRDEIGQRIAAHAHQAVRREKLLDLLPRAPAQERQLIADRPVLLASPSAARRRHRRAGVELAVDHDEAPALAQDADPLVDRRFRVGEGPEHVAADDEIEAGGSERKLLGIALLETYRDAALGGLAARLGDHGGREVHAGDAMRAGGELEGEE